MTNNEIFFYFDDTFPKKNHSQWVLRSTICTQPSLSALVDLSNLWQSQRTLQCSVNMCSQKSFKYLCLCCNVVFYVEKIHSGDEECRHFTDVMVKFIASVTTDATLYYTVGNFCWQTSMGSTWVCCCQGLTVFKYWSYHLLPGIPCGLTGLSLYLYSEFLQWWFNLKYYSWVKLLFLLLQNRHV